MTCINNIGEAMLTVESSPPFCRFTMSWGTVRSIPIVLKMLKARFHIFSWVSNWNAGHDLMIRCPAKIATRYTAQIA